MRIGPAIHGALLVLALVFAYKTWTRDKTEEPKGGDVVVWSESADDFESLVFKAKNKEVTIERRADEGATYLWGTVKRTRSKVNKARDIPAHGGHGGHGGHGHGGGAAPKDDHSKDATKPDGAKPGDATKPGDAKKPGAADAKKPSAKKPAAKKPAAKKPAAKKPAAKKPAAKKPADGKKADQNDQIPPADKKKPAPTKPAPTKPAPAKPTGGKTPAAPAKPATTDKKPAAGAPTPAATPATGAPAAAPNPHSKPLAAAKKEDEQETTVRQFPVGDAGDDLLTNFANLRALRTFGTPSEDEKIEFGLDDSEERIVVKFKGGVEHTLLVGDRVYGGSDRYVLDEKSGKGYVLASAIMKHLDSAETALGLKKYNSFSLKEDLFQITVDVNGATETLMRLEVPDEKKDKKTTRLTWAKKETSTIEDVTMANFVDRASKLRPVEYLPDLDASTLTLLARFEYGDKDGKSIGYLDFFKGTDPASAKDGQPAKEEYFMRTERTRVVGKVSKLTAERVEGDLSEVFGAATPEDGSGPTE